MLIKQHILPTSLEHVNKRQSAKKEEALMNMTTISELERIKILQELENSKLEAKDWVCGQSELEAKDWVCGQSELEAKDWVCGQGVYFR